MRIGIVGVGRMGRALASRLSQQGGYSLCLFDKHAGRRQALAAKLCAEAVSSLADMEALPLVILAVPDGEVLECIRVFGRMKLPPVVINIATNITRESLLQATEPSLTAVNVKFIGHAGELALGQRPVIIVDKSSGSMATVIQAVFQTVGDVVIGDSDLVGVINRIAAEEVLIAGVRIENRLRQAAISDPAMIRSAIRQVAAGTLKAFADKDLGPFAQEIVGAVRERINRT